MNPYSPVKWLMARLWRNFGHVYGPVYRSGQMGPVRLVITYLLYKPKSMIALNQDESSYKERFEKWFMTHMVGVGYASYNFSADGNTDSKATNEVITSLESWNKLGIKCIVHCAGGRDRTGGVLGMWLMRFEHMSLKEWLEQSAIHRIPSQGWIEAVIGECIGWTP